MSKCNLETKVTRDVTLHEEVSHLHQCLFGRAPSEQFIKAYVRAHAELQDLSALPQQQLRTVKTIIVKRLDAIGIEPWLRRKGIRHALTAKILLLAYLAECDADHPEFRRETAVGLMALVYMGCAATVGGWRLLRGYIQKMRYGLV